MAAVFAWGIGFYGPPIFLQVLHATYGWPVSAISFGITVHFPFGAGVVCWAYVWEPWHLFVIAPISGADRALTSDADRAEAITNQRNGFTSETVLAGDGKLRMVPFAYALDSSFTRL